MFCKKRVLKNLAKFPRKICVGVSFLIKLQAEGLFYRTPLVAACSCPDGLGALKAISAL